MDFKLLFAAYDMSVCIRAGKNLFFLNNFLRVFKGFLLTNAGHKITTHKQRFDHVNATNGNSYSYVICIKLVTRVKKNYNSDY